MRDYLRRYDSDRSLDDEIERQITAGREHCEARINMTLRQSVARQQSFSGFPTGPIYLDYRPLLAVSSIQYYDDSNVQQTLGATNYDVILSDDNRGFVEWTYTAVLPSTYSRSAAVDINYTTGYASNDVIPESAKLAIKMWVRAAVEDDPGEMAAIRTAAIRESIEAQLALIDPGSYR